MPADPAVTLVEVGATTKTAGGGNTTTPSWPSSTIPGEGLVCVGSKYYSQTDPAGVLPSMPSPWRLVTFIIDATFNVAVAVFALDPVNHTSARSGTETLTWTAGVNGASTAKLYRVAATDAATLEMNVWTATASTIGSAGDGGGTPAVDLGLGISIISKRNSTEVIGATTGFNPISVDTTTVGTATANVSTSHGYKHLTASADAGAAATWTTTNRPWAAATIVIRPAAAPAYGVAKDGGSASGTTATTTLAYTVPSGGFARGNRLYVFDAYSPGTTGLISGVADSRGNTYTGIQSFVIASGRAADDIYGRLFYCDIATALKDGDVITVTYSESDNRRMVSVAETYGIGVAGSSGVDAIGTATDNDGTATSPLTPAFAPRNTRGILLGVLGNHLGASATPGYTAGSGWTALTGSTASPGTVGRGIYWQWRPYVPGTAQAMTWTMTNGSVQWAYLLPFEAAVQIVAGAGGIASSEAWGVPSAAAVAAIVDAGAIASAEAWGSATVAIASTAQSVAGAGGIASLEAWGLPIVPSLQVVGAGGITSREAWGLPSIVQIVSGATLRNRLLAWYTLDEASGATAADSANAQDGTWTGTPSHVAAKRGNGSAFTPGNYVTIPSQSFSELSVSLWAKPAADGNTNLLAFGKTLIRFDTAGFHWWSDVFAGGGDYYAAFDASTWYHLAIVASGTSIVMYVNGVAVVTNPTTSTLNTTSGFTSHIGAYQGTAYYSGSADEVGIWNRQLNAVEVASLYDGGRGLAYSETGAAYGAGAIPSAEAWGSAVVSQIAAARTIIAIGIASAEAWGVPTALSVDVVGGIGIPSAEAWGIGNLVLARAFINPTGIASLEAWGVPTVSALAAVAGVGAIPSSEAWGAARVTLDLTVVGAGGISSAEGWGVPSVATGLVLVTGAGGIASLEAWGLASIAPPQATATGAGAILSAEAWGVPTVARVSIIVGAGAIPSAEAWGAGLIPALGLVVHVGDPFVSTDPYYVRPAGAGGILSAEAWGLPHAIRGFAARWTRGRLLRPPGLGCGIYDVFATTLGGTELISELPVGDLTFTRSSSSPGRATISTYGLPSFLASDCRRRLRDVRPWQSELAVYRDGVRVWVGPVVWRQFPGDGSPAQVEARTPSVRLERRRLRFDRSWDDPVDLATIFGQVTSDALSVGNEHGVTVEALPTGVTSTRTILAADRRLWSDEVGELERTGLPWHDRMRSLIAGGAEANQPRIGQLTDEHFAEAPDITNDGLAQANDWVVRGEGAGDDGGIEGFASSPSTPEGVLDAVADERGITDQAAATANAARRLSLTTATPVIVEGGVLDPSAPFAFDDLWPGALVRVVLVETEDYVDQWLELAELEVRADLRGERVSPTWSPPRSRLVEVAG